MCGSAELAAVTTRCRSEAATAPHPLRALPLPPSHPLSHPLRALACDAVFYAMVDWCDLPQHLRVIIVSQTFDAPNGLPDMRQTLTSKVSRVSRVSRVR